MAHHITIRMDYRVWITGYEKPTGGVWFSMKTGLYFHCFFIRGMDLGRNSTPEFLEPAIYIYIYISGPGLAAHFYS